MITNTGTLKLHLGCFDRPTRGWINTDITPHLWIARVPGLAALLYKGGKISCRRFEEHKAGIFNNITYLDVTKRFSYRDGTFDAVFSSHLLEHLYRDQAEACVGEIFRILKRGGICRIVVPDLDKIVADYNPEHPELCLKRIFECDRRSKNVHHWHYSAKSLSNLLKGRGFSDVCQCAYRQGRCPDLKLLDNRPDESLFVEAIK
jgi:SAM-dependent methyltransferase